MEPFLGEIKMVGFNFAPVGYATCDGQLIPISQNTALFSLLGTLYGGDGITTFALPDLRGRAPVHQGQGGGLSSRVQGEKAGEENHTLTPTEMPVHSHAVSLAGLPCSTEDGTTGSPEGAFPAVAAGPGGAVNAYRTAASPGKVTGAGGAGTAQPAGGSQPHNTMQPFLVVNCIIAVEGIYPSRN